MKDFILSNCTRKVIICMSTIQLYVYVCIYVNILRDILQKAAADTNFRTPKDKDHKEMIRIFWNEQFSQGTIALPSVSFLQSVIRKVGDKIWGLQYFLLGHYWETGKLSAAGQRGSHIRWACLFGLDGFWKCPLHTPSFRLQLCWL